VSHELFVKLGFENVFLDKEFKDIRTSHGCDSNVKTESLGWRLGMQNNGSFDIR